MCDNILDKTDAIDLKIRFADKNDVPIILGFIRELADYEQLLDEVVATEDILCEWLFEKEKAEVLIAELKGEPVGYALFFHNFSTFLGRSGIYLEDLYVRPVARGAGIGKQLLKYIAKLAVERSRGRLEWSCLDWNSKSISFYISLGATAMDDWTVYRLTGDTLSKLAGE